MKTTFLRSLINLRCARVSTDTRPWKQPHQGTSSFNCSKSMTKNTILQADRENRCILDRRRMVGKKTDFYKEKWGKVKINYEWYIYFALSPDTFKQKFLKSDFFKIQSQICSSFSFQSFHQRPLFCLSLSQLLLLQYTAVYPQKHPLYLDLCVLSVLEANFTLCHVAVSYE